MIAAANAGTANAATANASEETISAAAEVAAGIFVTQRARLYLAGCLIEWIFGIYLSCHLNSTQNSTHKK